MLTIVGVDGAAITSSKPNPSAVWVPPPTKDVVIVTSFRPKTVDAGIEMVASSFVGDTTLMLVTVMPVPAKAIDELALKFVLIPVMVVVRVLPAGLRYGSMKATDADKAPTRMLNPMFSYRFLALALLLLTSGT